MEDSPPKPKPSIWRRLYRDLRKSAIGRIAAAEALKAELNGGKYEISHLVQPGSQVVGGCIQDDEALFLFALVRGMRMRAALEIGGLDGYSALNIARALPPEEKTIVVSVDINPVPVVAGNHVSVRKDAREVGAGNFLPLFARRGITQKHFDLVFFDAHDYEAQTALLNALRREKMVNDDTVFALHDTCAHAYRDLAGIPHKPVSRENGATVYVDVDAEVERRMVNEFKAEGYDCFNLHPPADKYGDNFPFRHGLTICQKSRGLLI